MAALVHNKFLKQSAPGFLEFAMKGHSIPRFAAVVGLALGCNMTSQRPVAASDTAGTQPAPFTEAKTLTVPAGATIYVRLQQSLTSTTAQAGQEFGAVLDEPLV